MTDDKEPTLLDPEDLEESPEGAPLEEALAESKAKPSDTDEIIQQGTAVDEEEDSDEDFHKSARPDPEALKVADTPKRRSPSRKKSGSSVADFLLEELQQNIYRREDRFKPYLNGKITVELTDKKEILLFDWTDTDLRIEQSESSKGSDCVIALQQSDLYRIADGELNGQIAMLSNKIRVSGEHKLAIYFFHLLADRGN